MDLNDEGAVLPLLLRVPVDVAQYTTLIPALWNTEVQDWELKCMNSLVLDESHHGPKAEHCEKQRATQPNHVSGFKDKENASAPSEGEKTTEKADSVTGAKSVLTRVIRLAQRYLLDPMGRQRVEVKGSQTEAKPRQRSPAPGRVFRSRTSASLTQAQGRSRRRSQHRGGAQQPVVQGSSCDVIVTNPAGKSDRSEQTLKRTGTGPVGRVVSRRNNHSFIQPIRVKSLRLLRNGKNPLSQSPPSSVLPSSLRSSTLPPSSSIPPTSPPSSSASPSGAQQKKQDTPRTAFIKELSSRYQTSAPFRNARESKLI